MNIDKFLKKKRIIVVFGNSYVSETFNSGAFYSTPEGALRAIKKIMKKCGDIPARVVEIDMIGSTPTILYTVTKNKEGDLTIDSH